MRRFNDDRGLAGQILVGVIAWALVAVVMLTKTLVSAQQIDDRVFTIKNTVSPINHDLDSVALAAKTNEVAEQILVAAKPLSGQLDQVVQAATSIDTNAASINSTAGSINQTVHAIDGNARGINSDVLSINGTVKQINGTAKAINGTVKQIDGNVNGIAGSVNGINGSLSRTLDVAKLIRGDRGVSGFGEGLAGINRRLDTAIAVVQGIKSDTGNVLLIVGNIQKSAKSIDGKVGGPIAPRGARLD